MSLYLSFFALQTDAEIARHVRTVENNLVTTTLLRANG